MVYKIIWAPRALADLREVVSHIARDKPNAARGFGLKLIQTAESVATFPDRGRMIPKFASPDIRDIPCGPYRIAYRIRREPAYAPFVEIARIWHTARDDRQLSL